MALLYVVVLAVLGQAQGLVDLNCSDNATCIDLMTRDFVRSIRERKAVRLFDLFTIEPLDNVQGRANQDELTRLITSHGISFDWDEFTFRFSNPEYRSDALDLEVFESRTLKDETDPLAKKTKSKDEDVTPEDKSRRRPIRRRHRRKLMQAIIPLFIGMKSAAVAIFALAMVTVITLKAFMASKVALLVTIILAAKKFYESYGNGVGFQNNPYLYSQYPIDFPSASSHAYSISGVSPQFASQEMYSPTAMATHQHSNEILQQNDASAQQSQQAPTLLVNSTRAAERWDGKSKLLKYLVEPVVNTIRSVVDPIASIFYDAMPATFRGLNSDVSTTKNVETEVEEMVKPKEFLIPQPRHIAQRKTYRKSPRHRPKKYTEFKIDLDRLKRNKDLLDYIKTKKYKFNYPNTFYYPRIKYHVNPNPYAFPPNYNRLAPYRKGFLRQNITISENNTTVIPSTQNNLLLEPSDWKPIIIFNTTRSVPVNVTEKVRRKRINKKRKRVSRSVDGIESLDLSSKNNFNLLSRGIMNFFDLVDDPMGDFIEIADSYSKAVIHGHDKEPPIYYSFAYQLLTYTFDLIDGLFEVHEVIRNHLDDYSHSAKKKPKKTKKSKTKTQKQKVDLNKNETDIVSTNMSRLE